MSIWRRIYDEARMSEQTKTPRVDALLLEVNELRSYDNYGPIVSLARELETALSSAEARVQELAGLLLEYRKRELYDLMSEISEDCYCAGWMSGNEFRLWDAITDPNDDRKYGMWQIEEEQVTRLRELSELTNGWWVWEDDCAFIGLDEWKRRLAARQALEPK